MGTEEGRTRIVVIADTTLWPPCGADAPGLAVLQRNWRPDVVEVWGDPAGHVGLVLQHSRGPATD